MPSVEGHPFWRFSLALYRRAGVAEQCLRLQDEGGADVNLLLLSLWLAGERGIRLTEAEARSAVERTAEWRDGVVRPLREARRASKTASLLEDPERERFRAALKAVELQSERIEQDFLYAWATERWPDNSAAPDPGAGAANVKLLLSVQCGSAFAELAGGVAEALAGAAAKQP
jgi:uncharacterized protein (TIGR02444 family)